jgi:hypothetical protein
VTTSLILMDEILPVNFLSPALWPVIWFAP